MSLSFSVGHFDKLLEDKSLTPEQRRKIIASSVAINLIATAVSTQGTSHKLSEEMQHLSKYVEAIEAVLGPITGRK